MQITVTQEHLEKALRDGTEDTASGNPVCLAIAEQVGKQVRGIKGLEDSTSVVFVDGNECVLPLIASSFINWDSDVEVPFTFELDFP